jgi:tRNA pseudouridine55 synthase
MTQSSPVISPGIHLLHKPVGPTSFAVVQACHEAVQDQRKPPRLCHGGALDPFASGLLLVLVEPATKLFDYLHAVPKVYHATVRWGIETDNGDPLGKSIFEGDASALTPARLDEALASFIDWRDQTPPTTSNKRIEGERAYVRAHRGETFDMPASRVYLHEAHWLTHDLPNESTLAMTVRGGYYARALARDLGRLLGCGAHLSALHRAAIGPWVDPGLDHRVEVHGKDLLPWAASRVLVEKEVNELRQKRAIPRGELAPPEWMLPTGFPELEPLVRGFYKSRFCFLLKPEADALNVVNQFHGGL